MLELIPSPVILYCTVRGCSELIIAKFMIVLSLVQRKACIVIYIKIRFVFIKVSGF